MRKAFSAILPFKFFVPLLIYLW